jgi:CRP-like cAMP-binding protein
MTATATMTDFGRLIALSSQQLKQSCDADPQLGYVLMKRLSQVISRRLVATRIQLLDVFAERRNHS